MTCIALLHCSDLHIGSEVVNNPLSTLIGGYAGHDTLLCLALRTAIDDVWALAELPDDAAVHVVASGDLTVSGASSEFVNAIHCLEDLVTLGGPKPPSLFDVIARVQFQDSPSLSTIPGNHDHWDGSGIFMWGYNPNVAGLYFQPTPWRRVWRSGDLQLELFGVDSNAGFPPIPGHCNWPAFGKLKLTRNGRIEGMEELLKQSDAEQVGTEVRVRALVVHHSPSYPQRLTLSLERASKDALLSLAARHGIRAFLTGHTHDFGCPKPLGSRQGYRVWELRSASTLQGPPGRTPAPGFWAHKIWLDGRRQPHWDAWRFFWDGTRFAPLDRQRPCLPLF